MRAAHWILTAPLLFTLTACSVSTDDADPDPILVPGDAVGYDHPTVLGMLRLANDPASDLAFLMDGAGLANAPADAIVRHRQGADRIDGTWDDDPFDDGFELSRLVDVDEAALHALATAAHDLDLVPDLVLEGVPFTREQVDASLLLANTAPLSELDGALDSRAAESLVVGRPYTTVFEVAERPRMGPAALEALRDQASDWLDEGGEL
jgi:hypothetical protein